MNMETALELYHSKYTDVYDLEEYIEKVKEGLQLVRKKQELSSGSVRPPAEREKMLLELAMEYNQKAMLHFLLSPV